MWASQQERDAQFAAETSATYDFRIYNVWDNGEFFTGATIDLIERGRVVHTETFTASSEFENDGTAAAQASSYGSSYVESMEYSLEERIGPLGLEWEREQEERMAA